MGSAGRRGFERLYTNCRGLEESEGTQFLVRDKSARADVVGDIAGGVGEADDRLCANVGDHIVKSFPALLVEQLLSEPCPNRQIRLNDFLVERRNHDEIIAGV